ncbi:hypothetical protein FHS29_002993 [Saccharothrix tamanrassetensis]|uniref:Uncharacterized protein n=1 Tax=Saccharothrix tamanrassetensis TaxID=1051531 RepID=A0A841CJX4_9PSEU|nr:hypothetical protein [Saccharothrix tamanrassetensis]
MPLDQSAFAKIFCATSSRLGSESSTALRIRIRLLCPYDASFIGVSARSE